MKEKQNFKFVVWVKFPVWQQAWADGWAEIYEGFNPENQNVPFLSGARTHNKTQQKHFLKDGRPVQSLADKMRTMLLVNVNFFSTKGIKASAAFLKISLSIYSCLDVIKSTLLNAPNPVSV